MPQGKIKTLVEGKGFGFITQDGESADIFFHCSSLEGGQFDELMVGNSVQYDVGHGEKGARAENVRLV